MYIYIHTYTYLCTHIHIIFYKSAVESFLSDTSPVFVEHHPVQGWAPCGPLGSVGTLQFGGFELSDMRMTCEGPKLPKLA